MIKRILTDEMRDPKTPPDVIIQPQARTPVTDPTLGIPVNVNRQGTPRHRLVTIGDSLTQGFQSGAIFNTDISYPMLIAWEMGWDDYLRHPHFNGYGGVPFNLEWLCRQLELKFGNQVRWWELGAALFDIRHLLGEVEDYWDHGAGSRIPYEQGINHNLAFYGSDLRDNLSRTADICLAEIKQPSRTNFLVPLVANGYQISALRVLNSARDQAGKAFTPLQAAAALGAEGTLESGDGDGIETLIVLLGSNNALGSVVQLRVAWSADGYDDLEKKDKSGFTVWRPIHFQAELDKVVAEVKQIRARHVIWGTVAHVTIIPIARAVGPKVAPGSRYFPYYTRPWTSAKDFNPKDDPNITEQEARAIDSAIDQYNDAIAKAVKEARQEGRDWYLFETAGLLDRLASRRYIEDPLARPAWWTQYELPQALRSLSPIPDSRFYKSDASGRQSGGLFSMDGIHPTTIGYGIIAQELINIMQLAGVKFYLGDGHTERTGPIQVDFKRLIGLDTLISDPPRSLSSDLSWLGWLDQKLNIFKRLLGRGN